MKITPLEKWITAKLLLPDGVMLTRDLLEIYQVEKVQKVVSYVRQKSPFYRDLLSGWSENGIKNMKDIASLPFTTAADVREQEMRMLCTSQDEIERVVTLQTSGTTGAAKRLFFTADDLELTVDFFRHGMMTMVEAGNTVIVFLPGELPGSVGDLLSRALGTVGVKAVIHGPVRELAAARSEILRHDAPCLVGIPTQILALARGENADTIPHGWVKSVLLSTDYVPTAIREELERLWGCRVFAHYGMTETGLGGGVECEAQDGYHLREADLYTEIIDPDDGRLLPDGETGEVVFTTLTRNGMPLVRYRTGDLARIITDPCPCGTVLKRLGRVTGRIEAKLRIQGATLCMADLDEILFPVAGLLNFSAEVTELAGADYLNLCLQVCEGQGERVVEEVTAALWHSELLAPLLRRGSVTLGGITFNPAGWFTTGTGKRYIKDHRQRQITS
ncbi:MAG: DVU_1553 family AMP-dependent CoA ligase [Desulfuromonadales bacterium]